MLNWEKSRAVENRHTTDRAIEQACTLLKDQRTDLGPELAVCRNAERFQFSIKKKKKGKKEKN